jgi:isoleucyl-tRNA synthetase
LPRQLGSKYKDQFPQVRKAILALDANIAAETLLSEKPVEIESKGEVLEILPEEVEVRAEAKSGLRVAQDGAYLAALSTELTPDLIDEGLAREFIRRVQDLRKSSDFDISDRIKVYYQASAKLGKAVESFADYIKGEVLAAELLEEALPDNSKTSEEPFTFDGEEVMVGLVKV